ncbi:hypothetical protein FGF1_13960 [Flavobacteriaceae bacterium GF1]
MKTFVILIFAVFTYQSSTAQITDYYQQGYNTGCRLAQEYSEGVTSNFTIYQNTITDGNLPSEYRNGVREGWVNCLTTGGDRGSYAPCEGADRRNIFCWAGFPKKPKQSSK